MQSNLPSSSSGSSSSFGSSWSKPVGTFKKPPKNIVITENTLSDIKLAKKRTEQAIANNKQDQRRVELDVVLSGFTSKPNVDQTVTKLVELFKLTMRDVKTYHHFENRVNLSDGLSRVYHHIAITLKDKTTKVKLLQEKANMSGPLRLSTFAAVKKGQVDPIITCLPSLSKFNYTVQKQLTHLQTQGVISEFDFADTFHRFKLQPSSAWREVSHLGILDDLKDWRSR